jgi:hypothetical protein
VYGNAATSLYLPLGGETSVLADGALGVDWRPLTADLEASGELSTRLGFGPGPLRGVVVIEADGLLSTWAGPVGNLGVAARGTWEGTSVSLGLEPRVTFHAGDRLGWSPSARLTVDGLVGATVILGLTVTGDLDVPVVGLPEPGIGVRISAEWFPDAPLVIGAEIGGQCRASANAATLEIDGAAVTVPNYWAFTAGNGALTAKLSPGPRWDIGLSVPVTVRAADHGIVEGSSVLETRSWSVAAEPALSVGVWLGEWLRLAATVAAAVRAADGGVPTTELRAAAEMTLALP